MHITGAWPSPEEIEKAVQRIGSDWTVEQRRQRRVWAAARQRALLQYLQQSCSEESLCASEHRVAESAACCS
jgi:hypothetical protein